MNHLPEVGYRGPGAELASRGATKKNLCTHPGEFYLVSSAPADG